MKALSLIFILFFILFAVSVKADNVQNNPSAYENCDAVWSNPQYAYTSDNSRASASTSTSGFYYCTWKGYSFNIPSNATINQVLVKVETYSTNINNEDLLLYVSNNSGATWSSSYFIDYTGTETIYTIDVTDAFAWTPAGLNNTNFRVRLGFSYLLSGGGFDPESEIGLWNLNEPCSGFLDCWKKRMKLEKISNIKVGDKVLGWNWTKGFVVATITNFTWFPKTDMYKIITEYPEKYGWLCENLKNANLTKPDLYEKYGLDKNKCYKDFAVSWNHMVYDPVRNERIPAFKLDVDNYISGLYINENSGLELFPSRIVKIVKYEGESIHIETDADFIFAHHIMAVFVKETTYVDWIPVNVTYTLPGQIYNYIIADSMQTGEAKYRQYSSQRISSSYLVFSELLSRISLLERIQTDSFGIKAIVEFFMIMKPLDYCFEVRRVGSVVTCIKDKVAQVSCLDTVRINKWLYICLLTDRLLAVIIL